MSFKVAASDFDGTIYRGEKISDDDIAAVRAWRAAGNKFGIVTGRPVIMLAPQLKTLGLDVDFFICCNGAVIYDIDGQTVFETALTKNILRDVINEPCASKSYHFAFEAADEIFCVIQSDKSWILREESRWKFPVEFIDVAQVPTIPKPINQLALGFDTPDEAQAAADVLNQKFGNELFAQKNTHSLDIVPAGVNKGSGVENLLRFMNWRGAKVFVVGDESNDLPMIKKFGGYTVATAKDFVKREVSAVFDSVGDMLNSFRDN